MTENNPEPNPKIRIKRYTIDFKLFTLIIFPHDGVTRLYAVMSRFRCLVYFVQCIAYGVNTTINVSRIAQFSLS